MSVRLQELIHKYEVGSGYRFLTCVLGFFALLALGFGYNLMAYRNLTTAAGMDAAQLARNIAEGRGYTTQFIRPISLFLLKKHADAQARSTPLATPSTDTNAQASTLPGTNGTAFAAGATNAPASAGWARIADHPDLTNPPVYPVMLAGLLQLMPQSFFKLPVDQPFKVFQPDLWIAVFNQLILGVLVWLVFRTARKLFDEPVAWTAAILVAGTELFWRLTLTGLPALTLMLWVMALAATLSALDRAARDPAATGGRLSWLAIASSLFLTLAILTRYSAVALVVPAFVFILTLPHAARGRLAGLAFLVFAAGVTPWLVRNYVVSGTLFGTSGLTIYHGLSHYAGTDLERFFTPDFSLLGTADYWLKLLSNGRDLLQRDLLSLAGSWATPLFLAGLFVPFRNPTLGRVRWFTAGSLALLAVCQALGPVTLPNAAPDLNNNLLVAVAPLVAIFGVSLLYNLLEHFAVPSLRYSIAGLVCFLASLPLFIVLILPSPSPIVYPPYYPPWIQTKAEWIDKNDWMVSDIPWAVAWYGNRTCAWLPVKYGTRENPRDNFFALNNLKPVSGLYLTGETLKLLDVEAVAQWRENPGEDRDWMQFQRGVRMMADQLASRNSRDPLLEPLKNLYELADSHWIRGGGEDWESFVIGILINQEVPTGFPLRWAPAGLSPEIFLTDTERGG